MAAAVSKLGATAARYKCSVQYVGTRFHGFQAQVDVNGKVLPTVQKSLQDAVLQFAGGQDKCSRVFGSSRTDTGVHALHNTFHVDIVRRHRRTGELLPPHPAETVHKGLNYYLYRNNCDPQVAITSVEEMPMSFHARYHAIERRYVYRLVSHADPETRMCLFEHRRAWHVRRSLDQAAMQDAADRLLGHHDFTSFRAIGDPKNPMKTLDALTVTTLDDHEMLSPLTNRAQILHIETRAKSFLHNQVRLMVGALVDVGKGKLTPDDMERILKAKDRMLVQTMAPAHGLYLANVAYPDDYEEYFADDPRWTEVIAQHRRC